MSARFPIDSEGVWCEVLTQPPRNQAALFLDRDGVIIEDTEYLSRPEDIVIISGASRVIAAANARGTPVVLITNQSGIGRGLYGWAEFSAVQSALTAMLASENARIDAVFAVPHHRDGTGEHAHPDHPARKPNPGMLTRARDALALHLAKSWLIGDRASDILAAQRAGLAGALHVLTGYGHHDREKLPGVPTSFDLRLGRSIADAIDLPIVRQE